MTGRNLSAAESLLKQLYQVGVRDLVICAGARNSPLVMLLDKSKGFTSTSFFEERSASFFALGRARRDQRPVAIITTSGTAAAELLPAVIEAFHSGIPLIAVTADRPRRLRGTGAPQAIDQIGLYRKFVSCEIDVEAGEHIALPAWDRVRPLHVNICFDEPLIDGTVTSIDFSKEKPQPLAAPAAAGDLRAIAQGFLDFIARVRTPVAVVGTLNTHEEREIVAEFLHATKMPAYLEATSGLREDPRFAQQVLRSGDRVLSWGLERGKIDAIVRLGGVPTVRIWRDLDNPESKVEVYSFSALAFSGLSRGTHVEGPLSLVLKFATSQLKKSQTLFDSPALFARDHEGNRLLQSLIAKEPSSEVALVHALSKLVPSKAITYVGNSLPIREWDLAAQTERVQTVLANRGVNGIDGQLSSFLGALQPRGEGWAIVGDLTALYDLTAPWALKSLDAKAVVCIVNNGGGQIFSRIFKSDLFENKHALDFSGWAKMWNLAYERWPSIPEKWKAESSTVIEVVPDPEASKRFWDAYEEFWKST